MLQLVSISSGMLVFSIIALIFAEIDSKSQTLEKRLFNISTIGNIEIPRDEEENTSFSDRFLKPILNKVISFIGMALPINGTNLQKVHYQLKQAGINKSAKDYIAVNIMLIVLFGMAGYLLAFIEALPLMTKIVYGAIGMLFGYTIRRFQLTSAISKRKQEMENALPEVLDMLSVCVEAGLGFDQALQYVVMRCKGKLIDEFSTVQREISLGRKRSEALKLMSDRCNIDDIRSFVGIVVQADELGFSIKNVLKMQASAIRLAHKQKTEEKAMKIPIKILIPLVVFIFPVIFIILLGPAIPSIMSSIGG